MYVLLIFSSWRRTKWNWKTSSSRNKRRLLIGCGSAWINWKLKNGAVSAVLLLHWPCRRICSGKHNVKVLRPFCCMCICLFCRHTRWESPVGSMQCGLHTFRTDVKEHWRTCLCCSVLLQWRNTSWCLWDERAEKDSVCFVDSKENKWVGS